jgi:phenylacetate-coenzyme A ligase PaaK-like adenylate-forming protein
MAQRQRQEDYLEKVRWQVVWAQEDAPAMREKMDKAGVAPQDIRQISDTEAPD